MDRTDYFFTQRHYKEIGQKSRKNLSGQTCFFVKYENHDCYIIIFKGDSDKSEYESITKISIEEYESA